MPNIKSAKKRVKTSAKKAENNNVITTRTKTAVKKFETAVESGNKEEAQKLLVEATKKIDQAYSKGVLKLNTISRKKSNLAKKFNAMA